ncbi:DUF4282 domain-containing protein [Virgibacillus sp. W0430]|uniref:DUF4282 domain-containing protein n=1 Tax=Virgibacillus sp. W0430 TaxID=3391580 RepID=UPI003F476A80
MNLNNFSNFDKMLTPTIIKIVFWIGVVISVLMGLNMVLNGLNAPWGGGFQVIMGLLTIVIGPIVVRIYSELLIILFKMHESLQDIRSTLLNQAASSHIANSPRTQTIENDEK